MSALVEFCSTSVRSREKENGQKIEDEASEGRLDGAQVKDQQQIVSQAFHNGDVVDFDAFDNTEVLDTEVSC